MYDKGAVVNFDLILPSIPGDINDRNSWVGKVLFCLEAQSLQRRAGQD